MTRRSYAFAILVALALVANIPYVSMAENIQAGQAPQPQGGIAIVVGVDQPENCLRIRSGPGTYYDVIGCARMGDQLNITGVWTTNDWAQLSDNGWVYGPQIETDLRPPRQAFSESPSYVVQEEVTPDYANWAYLPGYGYATYWYGGIPLYVYGLNVWHWFHPWWWYRGHQAWWWQRGHHGRRPWNAEKFRNYVRARGYGGGVRHRANISSFNRAGSRRNFRIDRGRISPSNINRFRTRQFRSGSSNAFRGRTFSHPNRFRSRTFSTPRTFRSGSFGSRQFRGFARSGGFRGVHIGGGRSFHFGGGRGFHIGGGRSFHIGGGHFRGGGHRGGGRRR